MGGRDLAASPRAASSGRRSSPSSSRSWTCVTAHDARPPLLLLDDVFSELDPARRAHLVRRIAELPQAFVTTTTLDDLDPVAAGHRDAVGGPSRRICRSRRATRPRGPTGPARRWAPASWDPITPRPGFLRAVGG